MRELFSQCGDVCAVRIVRDRKSGVGKGFGYVHFKVGNILFTLSSLQMYTYILNKGAFCLPLLLFWKRKIRRGQKSLSFAS